MTRAPEKTRVQQRAAEYAGPTKSERGANLHSFPRKGRPEKHKERQLSESVAWTSDQPASPPRADRAGCLLQSVVEHEFRWLRARGIPLRVLAHWFLSPHQQHAGQKGNLCHETHRGRNLSRQVAIHWCSLVGLHFPWNLDQQLTYHGMHNRMPPSRTIAHIRFRYRLE